MLAGWRQDGKKAPHHPRTRFRSKLLWSARLSTLLLWRRPTHNTELPVSPSLTFFLRPLFLLPPCSPGAPPPFNHFLPQILISAAQHLFPRQIAPSSWWTYFKIALIMWFKFFIPIIIFPHFLKTKDVFRLLKNRPYLTRQSSTFLSALLPSGLMLSPIFLSPPCACPAWPRSFCHRLNPPPPWNPWVSLLKGLHLLKF